MTQDLFEEKELTPPVPAPSKPEKTGIGWVDLIGVAVVASAFSAIVSYNLAARATDDAIQAAMAQSPKIVVLNTLDQKLPQDEKSADYKRIVKELQDRRDKLEEQGYTVLDGRAVISAPSSVMLPVVQ